MPYAVAVNSGTAALHLALDALGILPDEEVILPTYTFASTAEVVVYRQARPILVDICQSDLNIDLSAAERAISPKTRAIIGVDIGGHPCDWEGLRRLAQKYGLKLIDDAAHALPSTLSEQLIGSWADLTAFSFYATKTLTTGEGGMLVTNNLAWAERAAMMSLHGIGNDAWKRYEEGGSWFYQVLAAGYKYNMTDLAASLGLVQLDRLDSMNSRRASIAKRYTLAFEHVPELELPAVKAGRTTSWHLYLLRLHLDRLTCDRNEFIRQLHERSIGTSVHFIPLHLHPYYRTNYGFVPQDFPVAHREYLRIISLPIYSAMSDDDVEDVIDAVTATTLLNRR